MTTELKSCPFCGGKAAYFDDFYREGFISAVSCVDCPACVISAHEPEAKKELEEAWNKRSLAND